MKTLKSEELQALSALLHELAPILTLPKRELFAAMICAGQAANTEMTQTHYEKSAEYAVKQADALIAQLAHNTTTT